MKYTLLSLATIFSLSACNAVKNKKSAAGPLAYKTWELSAIGTDKAPQAAKVPTIYFSDSTKAVSGNGGCNSFGAKYTTGTDASIAIKTLISTKMACMPGSDMEYKIFSALQSVDNYQISNHTLILKKGAIILLEYKEADKK